MACEGQRTTWQAGQALSFHLVNCGDGNGTLRLGNKPLYRPLPTSRLTTLFFSLYFALRSNSAKVLLFLMAGSLTIS